MALAALTLAALAEADPQQEVDDFGAARDIAFDTGAKVEIGTPLGPVIGKVVESADGEHKHIQGGVKTVAVVLDALHFRTLSMMSTLETTLTFHRLISKITYKRST